MEQIRPIGRNTQGVRLIRLNPGDKLVAAEKIVCDDANSQEGPDADSEPPEKDLTNKEAEHNDAEPQNDVTDDSNG
jgi:DNA gyrase/topoisomerase IV subunit A